MAKGNRKERRAAETARALGSGDVGALSRLAERGAEYARGPIVRALGSVTAEAADSGALLALAADVAGRLRRQGQIGAAIEVAAAGADRSPLLRLERALCAFAIGRDDEAEAAAAADPRIARAMAPLLSATQPESERKAGRDLPSGLEAAAAAVHQAVRGKHAAARRALGGIPEAERRALLHGPIEAALALAARRASLRERDLAPLASLPRTEPFEAVRRAAAEEAVATSPALGRLACR